MSSKLWRLQVLKCFSHSSYWHRDPAGSDYWKHRYNVSHAHLMRSGSRIAPKIIIRSDVLLMVLHLDHTRENNCSAAPRLDKMAPGLAWTGHMLFLRIARDENAREWVHCPKKRAWIVRPQPTTMKSLNKAARWSVQVAQTYNSIGSVWLHHIVKLVW